MNIFAVEQHNIKHIWETVLPIMERVLDYNDETYTMDDVKVLLETGEALLICVEDENEVIACMTLQEEFHPTKKVLHMPILCGERMSEWLDDLGVMIPKLAKERGYDLLITKGRKGWGRALKKYGFKERYVSYGREL